MECEYTIMLLFMKITKFFRFLLAQLHLDSLTGKTSPKAIRTALKTLPTGSDVYDHVYNSAMERIEGQHLEQETLARRVTSWITCSKRPLTTFELQQALAVECGTQVLDQDNFTPIELLVSVCAGLVTADEESGMIRLIHYTTQEYFERTRNHWFPDAEADITKSCVSYLSLDIFGSRSCQIYSDLHDLLASNKLLSYAACNWGHHACVSSVQEDALILDFLESGDNLSVSTWAMVDSIYNGGMWWDHSTNPRMTPLHVTAYFGLRWSTAALLDLKYSAGPKDAFDCTPLYYAADKGHNEVAKLLLGRGADPNPHYISQYTPMHMPIHGAMRNGHLEMVKLLLEKNADPNARFKDLESLGRTSRPLQYAVQNEHLELAKLLLENNADPNTWYEGCEYIRTPLHHATVSGHLELVKLLLEHGADPKVQEYGKECCSTPLQHAMQNGHLELVKLLVDNNADSSIEDNRFGHAPTPLHYAAENGELELARRLLATHVNPNIQSNGRYSETPLHCATKNGHLELMGLLLDNNANPDIQDQYGLTSLHYAVMEEVDKMVTLILHKNADPSIQCFAGLTPLCYARQNGFQQMVGLLVNNVDHNEQPNPKRPRLQL